VQRPNGVWVYVYDVQIRNRFWELAETTNCHWSLEDVLT
jgi:hypothetical protein